MTLLEEHLVRKALAALREIAEECGDTPASKTLSLRFILMFTFVAAGGDPEKKWAWDHFWMNATRQKVEVEHQQAQDCYIRSRDAQSALNRICEWVGYTPDVDFMKHLDRINRIQQWEEHQRLLTLGRNSSPPDEADTP